MIDAVMYGMIPRKKIGDVRDRAAREQVEEPDDAAVVRPVLQVLDRARSRRTEPAGARRAGRRAMMHDREEDLVAQVGHPEHVPQAGEHGGATSSPGPDGTAAALAVGQCVPTSRRAAVAPRRGDDLDACRRPPRSPASRPREKACARTVSAFVSSPRPRTLTRPRLATRPLRAQDSGVDLGAGVEGLERVEVHDRVLDPERVLEALRLRRAAVQRRLATLEAGRDLLARALALRAPAGGLAALAADAATRRGGAASWSRETACRSWTFIS